MGAEAMNRAGRRAALRDGRLKRAPLGEGRWQTKADVDHAEKTIRGRVTLPRPGPCPHRYSGWVAELDGHVVGSCTGEAGHFSVYCADQFGRRWRTKK